MLGTIGMAQTTGKIAGIVKDANTNEPLAGANILVEGTSLGAAADLDGNFYIINISPGTYTVKVEMIGYKITKLQNLQVSVNRTTSLEIELIPDVLQADVIIIEADKIATKKDQTGSMTTVSSEQINVLPIESVNSIVNIQAGVVNGHFRGGRSNEVVYMIDGMPVTEVFGGQGQTANVEPEAIQDLEINMGTYNAEYGRAQSGVVNQVTKDGNNEFHGSVSGALANYYTSHSSIFFGLKNTEFDRNQDYKLQISGPIVKGKLFFFLNNRYQNNKNQLNGIYRFNMNDYSNFVSTEPAGWYSEHTGDNKYIPMNGSENLSFMAKITTNLMQSLKISLLFTRNDDRWANYDYTYIYDPKGQASSYRESNMYMLQINHSLSKSAFYVANLAYTDDYGGYYLYKNPADPRYLSDIYLGNNSETGFWTGGQNKNHDESWQRKTDFKFDLTWQINQKHSLKGGLQLTAHDLKNRTSTIENRYESLESDWSWQDSLIQKGKVISYLYQPEIRPDGTAYTDYYHFKPMEFSLYLQDKMEYEDMVLHIGVRGDYFNPFAAYPSQRRNPDNGAYFTDPSKMSTYPKADPQYQVSPRLGLAYQLGNKAILHFSYGHFFQMPPMYALYQNNDFLVYSPPYSVTMGNAQLKAQKNVEYEVGLWQELIKDMGLEVTLYYVDIYNLLSAVAITHYNQIPYGLYSNKDYGNTRGLTVKYDYRIGHFSAYVNYTLQFTRGNADNPTQSFNRVGDNQDPLTKLIVMSWDQRHTFNVTVGYNQDIWGTTMTGYYNSGTPFTWQPIEDSRLYQVNLYPNNSYQPTRYWVDLSAYYRFNLYNNLRFKLTLDIYNLLDRLNENYVNSQTGRAYTAIIEDTDRASQHSNFNTYEDRIHNPSMYSAPRLIKLGLGVEF